MRIISFFELRNFPTPINQALATFGLDVVGVADDQEVIDALAADSTDGVLVTGRAVPNWWRIEAKFAQLITMPRVVVTGWGTVSQRWTPDYVEAMGFDGHVSFSSDIELADFALALRRVFENAVTRGARPPVEPSRYVPDASIDEITGGDATNATLLALVASGRSDIQIARSVFLAPQTVRNRVHRMLEFANVSNRTELGAVYQHRLIVEKPPSDNQP